MCLVPEKSARHLRAEEALDVPPEAVDAGGHGRRLLPPRRGDRVAEGVGFGGGGGGRRRRRRVALDGVFEGAEAVGRRRGRPARRRCRRRAGRRVRGAVVTLPATDLKQQNSTQDTRS